MQLYSSNVPDRCKAAGNDAVTLEGIYTRAVQLEAGLFFQ